MKGMPSKTLAARLLDQRKIPYELRAYEVQEDELDAITVARKIGMPAEATFKTLVARGDRTGVLLICLPGNAALDLRRVASLTGNKRVDLVPVKEIQGLTGYIRGGVSPLGIKRAYPLLLDQSALALDRISISAGQRGLQLLLSPQALQAVTGATCAQVTAEG
jgi:Cys-tRNA(Pro)/Cys-tRNA(Cys) deacylase